MNELEPDKKNLKSGAHNFEKQKNESNLIEVGKTNYFPPHFGRSEVAFFNIKCPDVYIPLYNS